MSQSLAFDLPMLTRADGSPALCLVTGATGYIGGRLIRELLLRGYRVRVLARHASRLKDHEWFNQVEIVDGDATSEEVLAQALTGIDVAYYLLHSLMSKNDFEAEESAMAESFARLAKAAKVRRLIYLGGMVDQRQQSLSAHLQSRAEVGEVLRASGVPTIELRAGVVIGSGSASFEMLRYLTERLPIMTTPKWVETRIQPIAIRDVLRYLVGAAALPESVSGDYDIGGPNIYTYRDMMQQYAMSAGLRKRIIIPIPLLTPKLSSGWVGLVTPVPFTLAKRLVASLKNEVVARNDDIRRLIPDPEGGLTEFPRAVQLALKKIKEANVETSWSNATFPGAPSDPLPTDPDWAGGSLYTDVREVLSDNPIDVIWARAESIGGDNGYSTATWAWRLRGIADKFLGGAGLRRGRRDPNHLMEGESLDFWRVEAIERPTAASPTGLLRLRAEMVMPGLAWLEWAIDKTETGQTRVIQRAVYAPKGLLGHAYWWSVWPMHGFVFPSMVKYVATGQR